MMYGPAAENFLGLAQKAGVGLTVDGLGMLVEQAAVAFELWTGEAPLRTLCLPCSKAKPRINHLISSCDEPDLNRLYC